MNTIPVVGIDVSKEFSDFCILSPENDVFSRGKIYHHPASMEKALKLFASAEEAFGTKPVCIMESTAYYHKILLRFLNARGFKVILINPMQSKAIKDFNIRNVKTDKVDAYKLALLYRMKIIRPSIIPDASIQQLRDLCRNHYELSDQLVVAEARIRSGVEQIFPGYAKIFSRISGQASIAVLTAYPTPLDVLRADPEDITTTIMHATRRGQTWSENKASMIVAAAENASKITDTSKAYGAIIRSIAAVVQTLKQSIRETDLMIEQLVEENESLRENRMLLTTIPGIGNLTAAVLIAETGNFDLFKNAKALAAFYGVDPVVKQSGTTCCRSTRLSKRGSPLVRKMLRMIAHNNIHRCAGGKMINPVLAEYYQQKCTCKSAKTAECAVMRKLVGIIFAVMRDRKPFELRTPEEHRNIMKQNCISAVAISA